MKLINFKVMGDECGSLIALENNHNIPFEVKRVYFIYGTKTGIRRGYHAHKKLRQVAVCVSGSCKFLLINQDGSRNEVELNTPDTGLLIEHMVWREMFDFSPDCVLMVLADDYYDENDYIRDYAQFMKVIHNG